MIEYYTLRQLNINTVMGCLEVCDPGKTYMLLKRIIEEYAIAPEECGLPSNAWG